MLGKKKPMGIAMIPFLHIFSNKISRLLVKHDVRKIHIHKRKTLQILRSAKNGLEHKVPGEHRIPCECGKVYVRHSTRSIEERCKEHWGYMGLLQNKK
jgi:hypothetical protein